MTWREIRAMISRRLMEAGIEEFEYEAWVLMEWKLGVTRADYFMNPETEIDTEQQKRLEEVLRKREARAPLQYLMETCQFMGFDFYVDERVLIPRQDTEILVEQALSFLKKDREAGRPVKVLDLCTGSGCIGISVKLFCPEAEVVLSDVSPGALAVARRNARALGAEVSFIEGSLFENIMEDYDYILSNPPYIPAKDMEGLMPEVRRHEPQLALDGGEDGLYFYREICREAGRHLRPGGRLIFEIGMEQGEDLKRLMRGQNMEEIRIEKDLAGLDRVALGRRPLLQTKEVANV